MRKTPTFEQWLKDFEAVIDAPNPRRAKTPLLRCEISWPVPGWGAVPTVEIFEKILGALVRLRYSRCYGRVDAETGMIRKIGWLVNDLVLFYSPPDQSGELVPVEAVPEVEVEVEDDSTRSAIDFLRAYYCRYNVEISDEFLNELRILEARSQRESVVFGINDLMIELGEIDEFTALDRLDSFRDRTEDLKGDF